MRLYYRCVAIVDLITSNCEVHVFAEALGGKYMYVIGEGTSSQIVPVKEPVNPKKGDESLMNTGILTWSPTFHLCEKFAKTFTFVCVEDIIYRCCLLLLLSRSH